MKTTRLGAHTLTFAQGLVLRAERGTRASFAHFTGFAGRSASATMGRVVLSVFAFTRTVRRSCWADLFASPCLANFSGLACFVAVTAMLCIGLEVDTLAVASLLAVFTSELASAFFTHLTRPTKVPTLSTVFGVCLCIETLRAALGLFGCAGLDAGSKFAGFIGLACYILAGVGRLGTAAQGNCKQTRYKEQTSEDTTQHDLSLSEHA